MSRSRVLSRMVGGIAVVVAAAICVGAIGVPVFGAARQAIIGGVSDEALAQAWKLIDLELLVWTFGVALAIGVIAAILALPAAWAMRRLPAHWTALLVAPMLLPNYLVYVAWGLARAPGTWLGDALVSAQEPGLWKAANLAQSIGGLAMWAWPVAAIVMSGAARRVDRETIEALRLSGVSSGRRALVVLTEMRTGILAGVGLVALLMIGSGVPLHVAQIETYAIVVWRAMMETSDPGAVWIVASPLVLAALASGVGLGFVMQRCEDASVGVDRDERVGNRWIIAAAVIWCVSTIVPLVLFIAELRETASLWRRVPSVFGGGVIPDTLTVGAAVAGVCAMVMIGTGAGLSSERTWVRAFTRACVCAWLAIAMVPGVLIGFGVAASSFPPSLAWLGDSSAGVIIAQVARLGGIAAVGGWWLTRIESPGLRDARRIYAGDTTGAWWNTCGRSQAAAAIGIIIAIALLSAHEIEATVVAAAPGSRSLSQRMLSLLHYLREEELKVGAAWIMGVGLLLAFAGVLLAGRGRWPSGPGTRGSATAVLMCVATVLLVGCAQDDESNGALPDARIIGERGVITGQLFIPRAIDTDGRYLWIADKTDRIQRFDPETGTAVTAWRMPSVERGNPCGITVGPDGRIYVADTHEFCVRVYEVNESGRGERIATFGEYGQDDGQFTYPTDVAVAMDEAGTSVERIFVSEYGGNDRISTFDSSYRFLFAFGREGSGDQEFERPQSIAWDAQRQELVVVDTVNHRVGRFTANGDLLGWIGARGARPGEALGEFAYPYGLSLLGAGHALVSEFGNNRVQLIDLERKVGVATYGTAGREIGHLATPWAVTSIGPRAYVVDTGNHRIQSFELPRRVAER